MTALWLLAVGVFSISADPNAATIDGGPGPSREAGGTDNVTALSPPVPIAPVQPVYPERARLAGRAGTVVVRLEIDETGHVTSATVAQSVDPDLDTAALVAARATRFLPARDGEKPIRAIIDWRVDFIPPVVAPSRVPVSVTPSAPPDPTVERRGHVEGRVLAKGTRKGVSGATVTINLDALGETDSNGRFSGEIPCGARNITIQAPGFDPVRVERDPCIDPSPLLVRLPPRPRGTVFETVIRPQTSVPSLSLRTQELTKTPGSLGDPFRVIESLPGVSAVMWPAPVYAVRGANPGNTGFFLDDMRVPCLFHLLLGPSVVHPYFFDSLDFYPGGYPARHGRYVAGIVTAQTRQPPADMVHASVDVRLFDAGGLVSAPFPDGNGSLAVAARYSYTAALLSLFTSAVRLKYWDYQIRADRLLGTTRMTLLVFGSDDLFSTSGSDASLNELALRFSRVHLRSTTPLGRGLLTASLGLGIDHSKAPLADSLPLTIDSLSATPRLGFRWPTKHADLELGFDGEFQRFSPLTAIARPGLLDLANKRDARMMAVYASVVIRTSQRLLLTPEVRLDTYSVSGSNKADVGPRLSARLALDDDRTWLSAIGGRFTQTPSLPLQIPGAESFGLALYGLQTSWQGSFGIGTRRFAGLESTVTGYVQRYVLVDVRDPTLSTIDPLAPDFLVRRDALSYGVEVLIRRPNVERLHGWLAYTLSQNQRALGAGVIAPSDWDQRHILNLVVGYRIGDYTVGGRAHLHTGRPVLIDQATPQELRRLPTFYQIDLRADRRFVMNAFTFEIYFELVNATLSREVVALRQDFAMINPTPRSFRIVLPSIGVHGEF